ncbi:hypothetical protein M9H77_17192 [Catharanthus roseus]|uniref:Uncharacterized protein n=1 Tax=Catharanthus roseus TaxID=4058 RepID=A0ACC0B3W4_CATRO|nr:hypothetical protein M9H77_17192 [Catharanthus roseus]
MSPNLSISKIGRPFSKTGRPVGSHVSLKTFEDPTKTVATGYLVSSNPTKWYKKKTCDAFVVLAQLYSSFLSRALQTYYASLSTCTAYPVWFARTGIGPAGIF